MAEFQQEQSDIRSAELHKQHTQNLHVLGEITALSKKVTDCEKEGKENQISLMEKNLQIS